MGYVRRVEPVAVEWRGFSWDSGAFDTARRSFTELVEGTICTPRHLLLVTLGGGARRFEVTTSSQKPATSWTAYDLALRGDAAYRAYRASWALDALYECRRLYTEARRVDADNASISARLAFACVAAYRNPADPECGSLSLLKHGCDLAEEAVGLAGR